MTKGYARFITVLFCLFLGGLMVWQAILPDRERSDVENRTLAQMPELTVSGVLDGTYMEALEEYVQSIWASSPRQRRSGRTSSRQVPRTGIRSRFCSRRRAWGSLWWTLPVS